MLNRALQHYNRADVGLEKYQAVTYGLKESKTYQLRRYA